MIWLIGENGELVNLALVSVVRAQQAAAQASWSVTASVQGGSNVPLMRGSKEACEQRVRHIQEEIVRAGGKFV